MLALPFIGVPSSAAMAKENTGSTTNQAAQQPTYMEDLRSALLQESQEDAIPTNIDGAAWARFLQNWGCGSQSPIQ